MVLHRLRHAVDQAVDPVLAVGVRAERPTSAFAGGS